MKKKYKSIIFSAVLAILLLFSTIIALPQQTKITEEKIINYDDEYNQIYSLENGFVQYETGDLLYPVMTERTADPKTKISDDPPLPTISLANLPPQFSWTDFSGDWTSPVKDQGSCGSCWAFSAIAIMESSINIASGFPDTDIDLSEQYILSCLPYGGSCNGGWTDDALEAIISESTSIGNGINGVPLESCMPYQAKDYIPCSDKCSDWDYFTDPVQPDNVLWQLESWGANHGLENDNPSDRDIVKGYLLQYGPISSSMYATSGFSSYWNSHHDSEDWYFEDDYYGTNHAVELVGWKDDASVTNGGFWRLKNSWGTGFGYGGYFNVAYGGLTIAEKVRWCTTTEWPQSQKGPGPGEYDMHVFCDFNYGPEYPHLGEEIAFTDVSDGDVTLREWDFDGDGVIDSTKKNPTYMYTKEGEYEVTLTVWSAWGLKSTRTSIVEIKETWPPAAVCTPSEHVDNDLDYHFDGRYSYDVDGGRITSYHWDFDDGTTSDESNVAHTFPQGDKIYEVKLTVTDDDGASSTTICNVKIDITIPPVTELIISGTEEQDWYRFTKKISFEAEDWTSVSHTYYRIDGGGWIEYKPTKQMFIPISAEGTHTVEYYSVDFYGNEENVKSAIIRIDKTLPTLDISVTGNQQSGWYNTPVTVSLNGDDALSGIDLIIYKVDSGTWQEYSGSFILNDGQHRLWAYSIDKAGNRYGSDDAMFVNVDTDDPTTVCNLVGQGSGNLYYKSVDVILASSDAGSGVDMTYYRMEGEGFNDGSFLEYGGGINIDEVGDYAITYYAIDKLGNQGEQQTKEFSILPVNFVLNMDKPGNHLYLFGMELFTLSQPLIIGNIDVVAEADAFTGSAADIAYVEFVVDGTVKMTDSSAPYAWRLDEQLFGSHEIGINAVSSEGLVVSESVTAQCFIF